ncbi:hypothetical protein B296_00018232 [Ensete ventricosum]|uniref:Uncharacterized protein n=1 Tax=Ensete ventricosum TaxID=4639 RepID=A0A426YSU0_ENSVE|nr:hypothetical protein B296_00018232 [Ensete ventricosum]
MSLLRCNQPRERLCNPSSLCSKTRTYLPTPRTILAFIQRSWTSSTPTNPGTSVVTPEAFQGLTNQVQAIPQAAYPHQAGTTLPTKRQPPTIWSVDDLPRFLLEFDQALFGDVARRPTPTPSASVHSLSDPDTLSSNSIDSMRAQLRLVNQRIDDVHKTIRTKDVCGESPLCAFVQEIQDTRISQHFRLLMLEVYDGRSDPMEHVVAFQAHMALYGMSDAITCQASRRISEESHEDSTVGCHPPPFTLLINSQGSSRPTSSLVHDQSRPLHPSLG